MSTLNIKSENGKIFCPLADSWHIETPEEKVRQEYIKILVEDYGYSLDQMAQEIKVNNSQRGQGKARADIVIWKSKQDKIESKAAFIVVECKAENAGITSTGAVSAGNQLPTLQDEYKEYRIAKKLWNEANSVVSYTINSQGRLFRTSDGKEVELKWYNLFAEYCKFDRQMVVATHSPILAQLAKEKELLMLELENGKSTILTDEKIEKIKKLSGTSWDVIGQGMMLRSSRPLVVFEGKTDVMYVKRALEMLKSRVTDYASLNVDFLNANGAGNVKSFIDNLKAFVPDSKKIVVFFDRDNAGKDGVQAITGISKNDERVAHYQDIVQDNITTSFIPYKDGVTEGDFLIEDYFSWDDTIKAIVEDVIPDRKHPIKMLPNLPDKIKKELEKRINQFEADEFNGFIPLLDKIVELTKEQAV